MGYQLSYSNVLNDGDWGDLLKPIIKEGIPHKIKYKGYRDAFYRYRRAIKVMLGSDDEGEDDLLGALVQVGDEAYLMEVIAPSVVNLQAILSRIRIINEQYKQQADFASITLSNFAIEPIRGKYLATCTVMARKASGDQT